MTLRILALSFVLLCGVSAHASTLSVPVPTAGAGTTFELPIYLDTESENINTVEGYLHVPEGITIDNITSAGSALTLFVHEPSFSRSDRTISFTGGATKGIAANSHALLFTVRAHADLPGSYSFKPSGFMAYRNDGEGTALSISTQPVVVAVGEEGSAVAAKPSTATPTPLLAEIGSDASLFEGSYFMIISGGDAGTGVDHYLVREGFMSKPVTSDRFYVLHDQRQEHSLWVKAVNRDGKVVSTFVLAPHPWKELTMLGGILLVIVLAGYLLIRKFVRRS